jgi:hypothetical protein
VNVRRTHTLASPECVRRVEITDPKTELGGRAAQRVISVTKSTSGRTVAGGTTKSP